MAVAVIWVLGNFFVYRASAFLFCSATEGRVKIRKPFGPMEPAGADRTRYIAETSLDFETVFALDGLEKYVLRTLLEELYLNNLEF